MGGKALVEKIDLPEMADPGELIIGTITIKNIGDESIPLGLETILLWSNKSYAWAPSPGTPWLVPSGESAEFVINGGRGAIEMPEVEAEIKVEGRVLVQGSPGQWTPRTDDIKSWTIKFPPPPVSLWKIGATVLASFATIVAIITVGDKKKG